MSKKQKISQANGSMLEPPASEISNPNSEPKDTRLIREITLRNILSFGPDTPPFELRPLNVLIGANGSGKSNLIDCIGLMKSTPIDINEAFTRGESNISEWVWKRTPKTISSLNLEFSPFRGDHCIRHYLSFELRQKDFRLIDERIENTEPDHGEKEPYFYYRFQNGHPVVNANIDPTLPRKLRKLEGEWEDIITRDDSILQYLSEPGIYPEIALLRSTYEKIHLFRDWLFGRLNPLRAAQFAYEEPSGLDEDYSNFAIHMHRLEGVPKAKNAVINALNLLSSSITDFRIRNLLDGNMQVMIEEGDIQYPSNRLSDGTLRYLCLLAILCDPVPPPLICIEEPELGLHPDVLPGLARLLIEASTRTQLIVTTHSDILVDAMTETPENVVVFDKYDGKTEMHRYSSEDIKDWLEEYRLGRIWAKGVIGGNRR